MSEIERSVTIAAAPDEVFAFVSDVRRLPDYMDHMTAARPERGDVVHVEAEVVAGAVREVAAHLFRGGNDAELHQPFGNNLLGHAAGRPEFVAGPAFPDAGLLRRQHQLVNLALRRTELA